MDPKIQLSLAFWRWKYHRIYGHIYLYFFSIPGCIKVVFLLWNRNEKTIGTSAREIDDLVFRDLSNDLEQTLSFF